MNGFTVSEVVLGIVIPLVLGSYVYSWLGMGSLWKGIKELRDETKDLVRNVQDNDIKHLEERIERLERGR